MFDHERFHAELQEKLRRKHERLEARLRRQHERWHWRHTKEGLRHYYGAHLRRRLFLWFGMTIFLTAGVMGATWHFTRWADRPPRILMLLFPALALWILSGKIARRLARPLRELVDVSEQIGQGNLSARANRAARGIDEIAILGRSMNDMAARIQRQLQDQRELLAAVSHELRTPLARIRVLLDIARERGATADTLNEVERETQEIDQLVGELLASARLEFQAVNRKPLDAVEVAARALERADLPAATLQSAATTAPFTGDPTLVARALANLLDNARKHGRGVDRLTVQTRPGFVTFLIDDRGPGFPPGQEQAVFQPFVRGAGVEADAPASGISLGLGLALVARIAKAHNGTVTAANRPEGGARLTLEFADH
jgi:two-component system OmpR family sensor kinase